MKGLQPRDPASPVIELPLDRVDILPKRYSQRQTVLNETGGGNYKSSGYRTNYEAYSVGKPCRNGCKCRV